MRWPPIPAFSRSTWESVVERASRDRTCSRRLQPGRRGVAHDARQPMRRVSAPRAPLLAVRRTVFPDTTTCRCPVDVWLTLEAGNVSGHCRTQRHRKDDHAPGALSTGLNKITKGSVHGAGGHRSPRPPTAHVVGVALVQEGKRIFRRRTVQENLLLGGYALGLRRRRLARTCERAYDRFPVLAGGQAMGTFRFRQRWPTADARHHAGFAERTKGAPARTSLRRASPPRLSRTCSKQFRD